MDQQRINKLLKSIKDETTGESQLEIMADEAYLLINNYSENTEPLSRLAYYMGNYFITQGCLSKAAVCFKRSLSINKQIFGLEHPYTASALSNLADVSMLEGDYISASVYYFKAIEISEKTIGSFAPFTVMTYCKIASSYRLLGQNAKAIGYFSKAMIALEEKKPKNQLLGEVYLNIAEIYYDLGDDKQSTAEYYQKAYDELSLWLSDTDKIIVHIKERLNAVK